VLALKALLLQKSAPNKYKQLMSMQVEKGLEIHLLASKKPGNVALQSAGKACIRNHSAWHVAWLIDFTQP
jgi:hypothetical protein